MLPTCRKDNYGYMSLPLVKQGITTAVINFDNAPKGTCTVCDNIDCLVARNLVSIYIRHPIPINLKDVIPFILRAICK